MQYLMGHARTMGCSPEGLPFRLPEGGEGFVVGGRLVQRVANDIWRRSRHDGCCFGGSGDGRVSAGSARGLRLGRRVVVGGGGGMRGGRTPDGLGEGRQRFSRSPSWQSPQSVGSVLVIEVPAHCGIASLRGNEKMRQSRVSIAQCTCRPPILSRCPSFPPFQVATALIILRSPSRVVAPRPFELFKPQDSHLFLSSVLVRRSNK